MTASWFPRWRSVMPSHYAAIPRDRWYDCGLDAFTSGDRFAIVRRRST
jgi:hypothetical protein